MIKPGDELGVISDVQIAIFIAIVDAAVTAVNLGAFRNVNVKN